ncbi:MAG: SpoIIE family protein phosphatase [Kineosporiaceae bacterium]
MPAPPARRPASVWPVLLTGLALAALVSSIAAFVALRNYRDDRDRELTRASNSAGAVAAYVDLYAREQVDRLRTIAATPALRSGDGAASVQVLRSVLTSEQAKVQRLVLLDTSGRLKARSDLPFPIPPAAALDLSSRSYVREVLRTGDPYVGQVIQLISDGKAAVPMSVPVRDPAGEVIGVLATSVRLPDAGGVSQELRRDDDEVVVADSNGHVIFSGPQVSTVTELDPRLSRFAATQLDPAYRRGHRDEPPAAYVRVDGQERLLAAAGVPTGGWVVVVDRDAGGLVREARDRLERTLGTLAMLLALGVAAVGWTGWRLARAHRQQERYRRRVGLLAELAEQAGQGLTVGVRGSRLLDTLVQRVGDVGVLECVPGPHSTTGGIRVLVRPEGADATAVLAAASRGLHPVPLGDADAPDELADVVELPLHGSDGPLGRLVLALRRDTKRPAYGPDDEAFLADVARVSGLSIDHALAFEREHEALLTYQRGLLPSKLPHVPGLRLDPAYRPGDSLMTVGGDWYDAFELPGGRLGLVIGDVVGHGVVASSAMGQLRSAARALAMQGLAPADLLAALDTFAAGVGGAELTTMVYVDLDPVTGELVYSRAGHLPPLLLDAAGTVRELDDGDGMPLASFPHPREQGIARLQPGGSLLLFTDGVVERRGEDLGDGIRRLGASARDRTAGGGVDGAARQGASVEGLADAVLGGMDLAGSDDTCLLVVTREASVIGLPEAPIPVAPRVAPHSG